MSEPLWELVRHLDDTDVRRQVMRWAVGRIESGASWDAVWDEAPHVEAMIEVDMQARRRLFAAVAGAAVPDSA